MALGSESRRLRVLCATILVSGFCFVSALKRAVELFRPRAAIPASSQIDLHVAAYDARFSDVRKRLASLNNGGKIGYVQRTHPQIHPYAGFFLAQYAVAPTVLELNDLGDGEYTAAVSRRYVLGDFHTKRSAEVFLEQTDWDIVEDFGNGLILFRNRAHAD